MRRVWTLAAATGLVAGSGTVSDWRRGKEDTVDRRIALASELIKKHMVVHGIPGLAVGLTVNGKKIFTQGFGYACLETGAPCTENTIMRIASISKPITATIAARLVGEGKLDLNKPIEEYLPDFPKKSFNNNPVQITTRQLLCHTGGIRHYAKKTEEADLEDNANNTSTKEFLSNKNYATVCDALKMFQDDDLLDSPGNSFNYTTHGLTLVSAVLEKAAGKDFPKLVRELCMKYELRNTYLDVNKRIIPYRAKYYVRTQEGVLNNCQEVDNSYKWAGGGLLSNVGDLLSLANFYLKSFHSLDEGFLQKGVLDDFWKGEIQTSADSTTKAALGWMRVDGLDGQEKTSSTLWYHTGAAVGASSILLIRPTPQKDPTVPSGLCLTMICNLQDTSLYSLANDIEALFHDYRSEPVIN